MRRGGGGGGVKFAAQMSPLFNYLIYFLTIIQNKFSERILKQIFIETFIHSFKCKCLFNFFYRSMETNKNNVWINFTELTILKKSNKQIKILQTLILVQLGNLNHSSWCVPIKMFVNLSIVLISICMFDIIQGNKNTFNKFPLSQYTKQFFC